MHLLKTAILCTGLSLGIVLFFLSIYPLKGYDQPLMFDIPSYLWRTNCVAEGGIHALKECRPPGGSSLPSRIGYPLVALPLSSILPVSDLTLAATVPVTAAVIIALATAALVVVATGSGIASFAVSAAAVAVSPMVVFMLQSPDTLLAVGVGIAGIALTVHVVRTGVGRAAASVHLAALGLLHWPTAVVLGTTLLGAGVICGLGKRCSRSVPGHTRGTLVTVAEVIAGAVLLWAAALAIAIRSLPDRFHVGPDEIARKLHRHLPAYGLPVAIPISVIGLVRLLRERRRPDWTASAQFLVTILAVWGAIVAASVIAWVSGWKLPVHRMLMLSLPLPILGAITLLWIGDAAHGRWRILRPLVLIGGVASVAAVGYFLWLRNEPALDTGRLRAARTAVGYLQRSVSSRRPVTFVAEGSTRMVRMMTGTIRVALPPDRISTTKVRVGVPVGPEHDHGKPVLLLLRGYSPRFDVLARQMPTSVVASDVLVLRGDPPPVSIPRAKAARILPLLGLVSVAAASLALLALTGYGWAQSSVAAGPAAALERLALAPAFGVTAVVFAGLIGSVVGLRPRGVGGLAILVLATGGGLVRTILSRK